MNEYEKAVNELYKKYGITTEPEKEKKEEEGIIRDIKEWSEMRLQEFKLLKPNDNANK